MIIHVGDGSWARKILSECYALPEGSNLLIRLSSLRSMKIILIRYLTNSEGTYDNADYFSFHMSFFSVTC